MNPTEEQTIRRLTGSQFVLINEKTGEVVYGRGLKRFHRHLFSGPIEHLAYYESMCFATAKNLIKEYETIHGKGACKQQGLRVKEFHLDDMVRDYKDKQEKWQNASRNFQVRWMGYSDQWFESMDRLLFDFVENHPALAARVLSNPGTLNMEYRWSLDILALLDNLNNARKQALEWVLIDDVTPKFL